MYDAQPVDGNMRMKLLRYATLLLLGGLVLSAEVPDKADQARLLRLPLLPVQVTKEGIPLTRALSDLGIHVRNGYVLFGVEVHLIGGKEPTVNLRLEPGSNLGDSLLQIFNQLPAYRFQMVGEHLINVFPAAAKKDPHNVLNLLVDHFDVANQQPGSILSRPEDFIPELEQLLTLKRKRTGPPQPSGYGGVRMLGTGPAVTLHLKNVTVRQVLNAVTEATENSPPNYSPLGWIYTFQRDPTSSIGAKHSWTVHWSVPQRAP